MLDLMQPCAIRFELGDDSDNVESDDDPVVVKWHVQEGAVVSAGDLVAEVEVVKTTVEVCTPVAGVVLKILIPTGSPVVHGGILAVVGAAGADYRAALVQTDHSLAVGIRCRGDCPECGARVAINGPHLQVSCAECGTTSKISAALWTMILADLTGNKEFSRILSDPWTLILRIVREPPQCHNCASELTLIPAPGDELAEVACPHCGLKHARTTAPEWMRAELPWVVGLLGTLEPKPLGGSAAPNACPTCGAQETTRPQHGGIPRCCYCGADVWSPSAKSPLPRRWYLLR